MPGLVTRRRSRRLSAIVTLALGLVMLSAGAAQASSEFSTGPTQFACNGGFCATIRNYASWNAVQGNSEGQHYWVITKLHPYATMNGVANAANTLGVHPQAGISVQALNAAGTVVANISFTANIGCETGYWDSTGLHWQSCRQYVEVPISTTKLKFRIKVVDPNKFGTGWDSTWTAPIV